MNLLAIDASSSNISIAVTWRGRVAVDFNRRQTFGASGIVSLLNKILKKKKIPLDGFDTFVIGRGPGSFTGLRISYSVVKAFAVALGKPVIEVSSFYSMAQPFMAAHDKIAVITDARRGLVYSAFFVGGRMRGREKLTSFSEALGGKPDYFLVTYDASVRDKGRNFYPRDVYPCARLLLSPAQRCYNNGQFSKVGGMGPLYLHPKDCQVRKKI